MTEEIRKEIAARKKARKLEERAKETRPARFMALLNAPIITIPDSPLLKGIGQ